MSSEVTISAAAMTPSPRGSYLPRSTSAIAAAQLAGQALAVVTAVLLARRLGVRGFGVYAFVTAVVFVANVATTFGTDMVVIREVAQEHRIDRCADAVGVQLSLSAVAIALVFAVSAAVPSGGSAFVAPVRIFALSLVPAALFSVATALLRGLSMLRAYAVLVVAAAAAPLAAVVMFVHAGDTMTHTMWVLLAAQAVLGLGAVMCCVKPVRAARPTLLPSRTGIIAMARTSGAIGGLGLIGVLYQRLAMLGVSVLVGPASTGLYSGASRVVEASKTGHTALGSAAFPLMAGAARDPGDAARNETLRRSWKACVALAAAATLVLVIAGPLLVDHLYGRAFHASRSAVVILAIGIVPSTLATFTSLAMLAEQREREVVRVVLVALAVLAGGLAVLVPTVGWLGACWAMLAADVAQAVGLTMRLRHRHIGSIA